jgi:bis(5'-adenosyl)-triphosphatase
MTNTQGDDKTWSLPGDYRNRLIELAQKLGWRLILGAFALATFFLSVASKISIGGFDFSLDEPWQRGTTGAAAVSAAVVLGIIERNLRRTSGVPTQANLSPGEFLETLDGSESFEAAFRGCERIDIMLRTGANVLSRQRHAIADATKSGALVRILILSPSSVAARTVYGPASAAYRDNARNLPGWIQDLESKCAKGKLKVKTTDYLPPFSMFIVDKRVKSDSYIRVQINFTHAVIGADRPTFRLGVNSEWFKKFEGEFREAWRAGKKSGSRNLQNILEVLQRLEYSDLQMSREVLSQNGGECPFDARGTHGRVFESSPLSMAIPNIQPITEGHCLIIPQRHVERLEEMTLEEVQDLFELARQVSLKFMEELSATGVNWALQDGYSAGQTVSHLHLHVIPRREGDLGHPGAWFEKLPGTKAVAEAIDDPGRKRLGDTELSEVSENMRRLME